MLRDVEWGEFELGELFEINTVKSFDEWKLNLFTNKQNNLIDFIWRTRENNWIKWYVQKMDIDPNPKDIISISQIWTIVAQIRKDEWYASQNIFSLKPKNKNLISLLVLSSINKVLWWTFSDWYSNYPTLKKLEKLKISLPITKSWKIDFDFIEKFVAELNASHLAELNAYLLATWLKDYKLTPREEKTLETFDELRGGV